MYMLHNIFPPNDVDTLQKVRVCVPWEYSEYRVIFTMSCYCIIIGRISSGGAVV